MSLSERVRRLQRAMGAQARSIAERLHAAEERRAELDAEQADAQWRAQCLDALTEPDLKGNDLAARLQRAHRRVAHYLGA